MTQTTQIPGLFGRAVLFTEEDEFEFMGLGIFEIVDLDFNKNQATTPYPSLYNNFRLFSVFLEIFLTERLMYLTLEEIQYNQSTTRSITLRNAVFLKSLKKIQKTFWIFTTIFTILGTKRRKLYIFLKIHLWMIPPVKKRLERQETKVHGLKVFFWTIESENISNGI